MKKQKIRSASKKVRSLVGIKKSKGHARVKLGKSKLKQYGGFKRYLTKSEINHILEEHGNATIERKKGQIAVTLNDFELIPYITATADKIEVNREKKSIKYIKKIDAVYYVIEVVTSEKKKRIFLKSMYKKAG